MDTLRWLYGLQHFGIKLGLDGIRALLQALGHPERAYPSVIVAGTNGKGSVAAMLHAMLAAGGVETGLYTSPHLVRPNERIRLGTHDIDDDALDALLDRLRVRIETALATGEIAVHPSFFEVTTAAALEAFRQRGMRAAILEVGLGGRLDATNAVDAELAVVVSVDLDHLKILGPTLERIAAEKAGVIRPGRSVVSGVSRQAAIDVLERTCRERGATLVDARATVELVGETTDGFTLRTPRQLYPRLRNALPGRHQIDNARVALAAFERFAALAGIEPEPATVRRGLAEVRWPGRLQWVRAKASRPDLLLDGAHNPAAMHVLACYLRSLDRPAPIAVLGAMQDKQLDRMFEPLAPLVAGAVATCPAVDRAAGPEEIASHARRQGIPRVEVVPQPAQALEAACRRAAPGGFVLVAGSLYLVGGILGLLEARPAPGPVAL